MSEEQLKAFLEAVKTDSGLQEKLKSAPDLDAAVAIAQGAGFDVSEADWPKHKADNELSDDELDGQLGGGGGICGPYVTANRFTFNC